MLEHSRCYRNCKRKKELKEMLKLFGKVIVLVLVVSLITGVVYAADVTTGMVGYWPLDGNAKDKSGKGNDGTGVGNPAWVNGRVGQAAKLDGKTQLIDIPGFKLTTDTATFAVWINGWKTDTWTGIMMSRSTTSDGIGFGDNDALHYTWNADSTWQWHLGPVIPKDKWVMVAVAFDPKLATAYTFTDADGLKSAVNQVAHLSETVDKLQLGNDNCCGLTRWFTGMIDEAVIYKRALTKDDIVELATKGLTTAVESSGKLAVTWAGLKK
jgi:hypothetical protein